MTTFTRTAPPEEAKAEAWKGRRLNPVEQWKFEAETKVFPANLEKGNRVGFVEYPDGSRAIFQR